MSDRERRPWRRCPSCYGVCHWHDDSWVCDTDKGGKGDGCGDEFDKLGADLPDRIEERS